MWWWCIFCVLGLCILAQLACVWEKYLHLAVNPQVNLLKPYGRKWDFDHAIAVMKQIGGDYGSRTVDVLHGRQFTIRQMQVVMSHVVKSNFILCMQAQDITCM